MLPSKTATELVDIKDTDPLQMPDLLTEVVRALVDYPSTVTISERSKGPRLALLMITVDPSDVGKVLGRKGKTIKTIRDLFSRVAAVEGRRVIIEVSDPRKTLSGRRK